MLSCPANISVGNDAGQCGAVVSFPDATFTGNCGTVSASPASGSFFPVGTTTVTVTGQRLDGSSDTCTFTVTVNDTEAPVFTTSGSVTLWPPNHKYQTVSVNDLVASVSDNCDPGVGVGYVVHCCDFGSKTPILPSRHRFMIERPLASVSMSYVSSSVPSGTM